MTLEERREYEDTIRTQWELHDMTPDDVAQDIFDFIHVEVCGRTHNEILDQLEDEDVLRLDLVMRTAEWC